jgi:hypothetical protein
MSRLSAFLLAIGFLTPASTSAQQSPQVDLTGVRTGQVVRIRTPQGQILEGRFSRSPARDAKLQLDDHDLPLTDTAIDSLWVRGNRGMTGALIGGVVFGAAGAVVGYWACNIDTEGQGCDDTGKVAGLSMVGVAVGAGLGALIGSTIGTWRLQYVRRGALHRLAVTLPL